LIFVASVRGEFNIEWCEKFGVQLGIIPTNVQTAGVDMANE
jgi:hypothetical protein